MLSSIGEKTGIDPHWWVIDTEACDPTRQEAALAAEAAAVAGAYATAARIVCEHRLRWKCMCPSCVASRRIALRQERLRLEREAS